MAPTPIALTSRDDELDMPTRALSTLSMWLYGSETQVRLKRPCSRGGAVVWVSAHVDQDEDGNKRANSTDVPKPVIFTSVDTIALEHAGGTIPWKHVYGVWQVEGSQKAWLGTPGVCLTVAHSRPKCSCSLMIITIDSTNPSSTIFAWSRKGWGSVAGI